jgi:hypothetical protein
VRHKASREEGRVGIGGKSTGLGTLDPSYPLVVLVSVRFDAPLGSTRIDAFSPCDVTKKNKSVVSSVTTPHVVLKGDLLLDKIKFEPRATARTTKRGAGRVALLLLDLPLEAMTTLDRSEERVV